MYNLSFVKGLIFISAAIVIFCDTHICKAQEDGEAAVQRAGILREKIPATALVEVLVRSIQAEDRIEETGDTPISIRIDSRLEDLADKLKKLPFRNFSFIGGDRKIVPVLKKGYIALANGQGLTFRPLYAEENSTAHKRIGLWLKWQDKSGLDILDTRMHFEEGQNMLLGTDLVANPNNGLILALEVSANPK